MVPLFQEFSLPSPQEISPTYTLPFQENLSLLFQEVEPFICIQANILPLPKQIPETLLIHLMKANLLGQGTGGFIIGIDPNEKFLTLSTYLPYEVEYRTLKESLEDFVNYILYWQKEIEKILEQTKKNIYS